jgi:hypothetical protein
MKVNSKYDTEDPKKKNISAATNFQTSSMMAPPNLNLSANPIGQSSTSAHASSQNASMKASKNNMVLKSQQQEQQSDPNNQHEDDKDQNDPNQFISSVNPSHIMSSISSAFDIFKSTAYLTNVSIHGPLAVGGPGSLNGIDIKTMIKSDSHLLGLQGANKHFVKAVTNVIGDAFNQWKDGLSIPSQMWYPAFSYFPGPYAPMMPNIPTQLAKLPSFGEYLLNNASYIAQRIMAEMPSEMHNSANAEKVQSIAEWTEEFFFIEQLSTFVSGVMGSGPIPGFQPPFSFGGAVINGKVLTNVGILH